MTSTRVQSLAMFLRITIFLIFLGCLCPVAFADSPNDVGTMLDVLNVVAGDVEKHYYDPKHVEMVRTLSMPRMSLLRSVRTFERSIGQ
jgi:hypothetical protein